MAFGNDSGTEGVTESLKGQSVDVDDLADEEGGAKKVNIDEDIEKNIQIKTIPKKFKVSTNRAEEGKTKAVGAVIMVVGVLVLGAAVYLAYVFLINPKGKTPSAPAPKASPAASQEKKAETPKASPIDEKKSTTSSESASGTGTPEETGWVQSIPTSTPAAAATSTSVAGASTTPESATSTPSGTILDSDGDGLSNVEEAVFGTNLEAADSDGDGYSDKAELGNFYNPAGSGRLDANLKISKYENAKFKYSVYYPYGWRLQSMGEGESVLFSSPDNTFVQVIAQSNEGNKSIVDWYSSQFPETPATADKVIAKDGWEGIYHVDNKIFYLTDAAKANVYVLSYVPEAEDDWSYYNVYKMMIDSFTVK